MSILSSNALPRDNGVLYHSISLFFNKTLSESRYRRLPEKGGFKFMELPAEIRNMIWELTIEQRLVKVRFTNQKLHGNKITHDFHLERTRSLSTWKALPIRFPNLDTFIVLFKSFVDPKTVDENTLPPCKYNKVWVPSRGQQKYTPTGRRHPAWVQHDRKVLEERTRAYLQPPIHWCQRNKQQKGHPRRTHLLGGKVMRRDPMHSHDWAMEKAQRYRKNLREAASGTQGVCWGAKLSVAGICEHGLEFEEAPELAYKGKFFRHFDDNHEAIKKFYEPGTVTGTVNDQKEAERRARREARKEAK
ncbi:uncharacterized protein EAE97_008834 [Botrytis byssoidea]|uniref:2EXR domain-containing protein n=1 Tax=Botrytis byssoidea TaxID=139641 RepID=A0A9P5I6I7_9HELO|nr:uncharacterized protein EAE97_008834 [Botrytis byssoidea]KAF7933067.1 hypothetical protein EAE97_008834 [Botrytis byssoidea]